MNDEYEFGNQEGDNEAVDTAVNAPADDEEISISDTPSDQVDLEEEESADDDKTISSDLIRGHINTIILRALYDGDKYGYEIIAEIERKSRGQYVLKQPSLYSALKRLEKEGYVTSYWGGSVGGGRRKYFSLTDNGKNMAEKNQSEWEYSRTVIDNLISDKEFDFENSATPSSVDMRMLRKSVSRISYRDEDDEEMEDDGDVEFEPKTFEDDEPYEDNSPAFDEELEKKRLELEEEHSRREEELLRREEELRTREELFRAEEAQWNRTIAEETEKLRLEEERRREEEEARIQEERALAEAEARRQEEARLLQAQQERALAEQAFREAEAERLRLKQEIEAREREDEERAYALSLSAEKGQQNARIVDMDATIETRNFYEEQLRAQEAELKARHERELAEQEERIRKEDEKIFRQREQQMIHQNYLNLVNVAPPYAEEAPREVAYNAPYVEQQARPAPTPPANPETDRSYRSVIQKLYSSAVVQPKEETPVEQAKPVAPVVTPPVAPPAPKQEEPTPPAPVVVTTPAPAKKETSPRLLGRIDFYDLETRAAQDGIRISTSGGGRKEVSAPNVSLVHKGKALFFSALIVFLLCIAEGSVALGLQNSLDLPRFFPYFIWGTGLALLLVTGLAYVNHYGERALRQTGNLIINTILSYALCLIGIFIVALAVQIDFTDIGQLTTYIAFPIVYFFGIIVFGVSYYLQICPTKETY